MMLLCVATRRVNIAGREDMVGPIVEKRQLPVFCHDAAHHMKLFNSLAVTFGSQYIMWFNFGKLAQF